MKTEACPSMLGNQTQGWTPKCQGLFMMLLCSHLPVPSAKAGEFLGPCLDICVCVYICIDIYIGGVAWKSQTKITRKLS